MLPHCHRLWANIKSTLVSVLCLLEQALGVVQAKEKQHYQQAQGDICPPHKNETSVLNKRTRRGSDSSMNSRNQTSVSLTLGQYCRRWNNGKSALGQCTVPIGLGAGSIKNWVQVGCETSAKEECKKHPF